MKIIIAGSRSITDRRLVDSAMKDQAPTEIVSGAARGVDFIGERWAHDNGVPVVIFPADWQKYGRRAGILRNCEMADYADALVAIWDGKSRGTQHMISEMQRRGKKVSITCPRPVHVP